jgi:hypothetical protein
MQRFSFRTLFSILLALIPVTVWAGEEGGPRDFGALNPAAPPETAQFSFAIGEWACTTRGRQPDGSVKEGAPATWTFYYILDGWAIQDNWVVRRPDRSEFRGTNIRSFNPQTGKWDNRWLPIGSLQWKYYEAEQVGDTMVMTGGRGKDAQEREFVDRNTFHSITENSWSWRKDRSFDGGKTWIEGVFFIDAKRVR